MSRLYSTKDKKGKLIVPGDLVRIDDAGMRHNFGGVAKVKEIRADSIVLVVVEAVDELTGGWTRGARFAFEPSRVTFLGGDAAVKREPVLTETAKAMQLYGETTKPTNPKDAIGSDKLPLHLWPETATALGTLGLLEGMLKYGRNNWRETGVRASIYVDAARRHLGAWFEGEDVAPDSGIPHLGHALACLAILVDAEAAGVLNDDRQYPGGYRAQLDAVTPHVARLKDKYADKDPKHWTIADGVGE